MIAWLPAAVFKLQGDKPRQQSSRVELADDRLNTAEAARDGMHRHNIAIADRGKRRKTEIDQIAEEIGASATLTPDNECGTSKSTIP
jgi:hypothetical protein